MSDDDARYGYSIMTDTWYRVSEWERIDDESIRAKSKEPVEREDVPEKWLDAVTERGER